MTSTPQHTKRALNMVFFIMLMDIIGLTILFPVAPFIVARYSNDAFWITALTGLYAAAQFFAAPALGRISDRFGRRPVLLVCVFGSAIGYFIFGIGGALWVLLLSRLIDGITGGNLSTCAAYIADVSKPEERAKNFGLIGVAFGLGFIIGPALGGLASQISLDAPAFLAGMISMISVAVMWFILPESLPKERRSSKPLGLSDFNPLVSIGQMLQKPGMWLLFAITLAFAFAFDALNAVSSKFFADRFNVDPATIGVYFVVSGIATLIAQARLVQPLVKRFGEKTMGIFSLFGQSIGAALLVLLPSFWMLVALAPVVAFVRGFIWGSLGSLAAAKVQPREQGTLSGVNTALQSLMAIAGPLAAGALYDNTGATVPFWVAVIVFIFGGLMMTRVVPTPKTAQAKAW